MTVGVDEEAEEAEEMEEVEQVEEEAEVEEWWRSGEIACSLSGSKVLPQKGHLGGGSGTFSTLGPAGGGRLRPRRASKVLKRRSGLRWSGLGLQMAQGKR